MKKYGLIFGLHSMGLVVLLVLFSPLDSMALAPEEVLVIANRRNSHGVQLARYYMKRRGIPKGNLLQLNVADKEVISRETYDSRIAIPTRKYLQEKDPSNNIRCLLTVFGMPLKISPPAISDKDKAAAGKLRKQRKALDEALKAAGSENKEEKDRIRKEIAAVQRQMDGLTKRKERAALDSELALVTAGDYLLSGWIPNPYFIGFKNKALLMDPKKVKWVCRLDGPTANVVRRIIDDSLRVERKGLKGKAYFDARWKEPESRQVTGYALYDKSVHRAAARVTSSGRMPVVVNGKQELFKSGEAPDAALYCGWYSLGKYVDAFKWRPGAIGYHIASSECTTLKRSGSQVWCKRMLEEGVAATVGPTSEPYVQGFPIPEVFFGLLVGGRFTLAECYSGALPFLSWQMVLIGDPLYRPFKPKDGET